MKKRRNLGHVSHYIFVEQHSSGPGGITEAELPSILSGLGYNHGSQINSGSVFITEPGSSLFLIGTDHEGNTRTFAFGITGSLLHMSPTGSS